MTTIETLFAAIENGDADALAACLAPGFAFQQSDGAVSLDAAAFCAGVAGLNKVSADLGLACGPARFQTAGIAIDVALDAQLNADVPALQDLVAAPGGIVTEPQTWTFSVHDQVITAIRADAIDGIGLAQVIDAVAAAPVVV